MGRRLFYLIAFTFMTYFYDMRKKLLHFQDNAEAVNIIEQGKEIYEGIKGNWSGYFNKSNPMVLELGCGQGSYTVALARRYPNVNFIGVDVKGARLWVGSQEALRDKLLNVAFLRVDILNLMSFFLSEEISEIYIPFPDPRPRDREAKKRLISPRFLALYEQLLVVGGKVHLKTDDGDLFDYARMVASGGAFREEVVVEDLYVDLEEDNIHRLVKTPYEVRFLAKGAKIRYVRWVLKR